MPSLRPVSPVLVKDTSIPWLVARRTSGSPGICQFPSPSQSSLPTGFINSTSSSVWICPLFSSPPSPLVQAISHPSPHYHLTTSLIYSPHNKWRNAKQTLLLFRLNLFKTSCLDLGNQYGAKHLDLYKAFINLLPSALLAGFVRIGSALPFNSFVLSRFCPL